MSRVAPPSTPPTSCQWAMDDEKATNSPSQKIGQGEDHVVQMAAHDEGRW